MRLDQRLAHRIRFKPVTISLPPGVHGAAIGHCRRKGITVSRFIADLLERRLNLEPTVRHSKGRPRRSNPRKTS